MQGRGVAIDIFSGDISCTALAVQGFTLLELLVMVIIGLFAGYVWPKYFAQIGKSEIKVAQVKIDALALSINIPGVRKLYADNFP
jgi:type II secretory pathway pseudopilin PulG